MKLADEEVAKLYGFDDIIGDDPAKVYAERNVKFLENPYSLNGKGPQNISMFKQSGGRRRTRRANHKRKATKRRGRRHH